jgi:hypothetical protein
MRSLPLLLAASVVVAVAGFVQPYFLWSSSDAERAIRIFMPAAVWLVVFVVALAAHGKRGLWLLIGAPLALLRPTGYALFFLVCGTSLFPAADCP